ncbi:MAG: MFS transporter [Paludibacterium sp.]|uniref:MFS transporter n=1 Tax=Paludibacterium sp. TaxID=1917523 RepID=UPI0025E79CDC|nr:MFS transporter [Paludibacterium sp.]MBV8047159.1 MFS transporter [Paludibacterium sp.]MBV8647734.1 MFS transporter [Paludibacterium sp.]
MSLSDDVSRRLALLSVCLAALAMPLSFTAPAIAMAGIRQELGGGPVALAWATNAFMLGFGASLMAAGTLADRWGRRKLFLLGTALFSLASLGLTLVPSLLAFNLLRALQGLGAAVALSSGLAGLAQRFGEHERLQAFSWIGTAFGIGLAFGPMMSGFLIGAAGWRVIFWAPVALTALAFLLARRVWPESADPSARLDWPGLAGFTASLGTLTTALLCLPDWGWDSRRFHLAMLAFLLLTGLYLWQALRAARPMLDLRLFRYPRFVGVQTLAAAPAYAFVVLLVLLPVRLVGVEGVSPLVAGLDMMWMTLPMLALPLLSARLSRRVPAAVLSAGGLLVCALGLSLLGTTARIDGNGTAGLAMALIGVGISFPWGVMDGLAVSVVPVERAGMAAGIFSTTRVAGEGVALAVVGAVLAALIRAHLPSDAAGAAAQLAMGNLTAASAGLPPALLTQAYAQAFQTLAFGLAAVTALTALTVYGFLRPSAA